MPNVSVPAAAIGLPFVTPHSPALLRGLRFVRPDGSYDRRAVFTRGRQLAALWTVEGSCERIYARPGRERWSRALRQAWREARDDRSMLHCRLDLKVEELRLEALAPVERELAAIAIDIRSYEFADGSSDYIARHVGPLAARAAAIRAAYPGQLAG